eukprot:CAMPEP_0185799506 /NCGR_PEP_ID=MMETSP1322-20130828/358_1 /TAXON_ID=265543 /ORGANISM="Minutocellus polymorphus, Strain RCC2270" /LENGTH=191 /DNA_ID=CAMNT_0028495083 /DNA_START=32 /DNA_END=607 /DNA_ORIENTATION=-
MKSVIALSFAAGAAAFAPSANVARSSTALAGDLSGEIGAQAPLGFWDPLDMTNGGEKDTFEELRAIELKHGRVAMLGVVGYLSTYAGNRFPGAEGSPSGLQALWNMSLNDYLWIFGTCAILEICNSDRAGTSEFRGDWRNGFDFGWDKQTDEWKNKKRAIELNQGRAAQMGILGLIVHDAMGNLNEILPTP